MDFRTISYHLEKYIKKLSYKLILIAAFTTTPLWGENQIAQNRACLQRLGALDIGSGSTKALGAIVNTCHGQIVKVLFEEQVPLAFNEALEKSGLKNEIPKEFAESAAPAIAELVKKMRKKNIEKISAIATSAFRKAKNGSSIAKMLSEKLAVPVQITSQEQEAEIGYASAIAQTKIPASAKRRILVWDIGGGSMQILFKENGKTKLFKGDLASVSFKNRVIAEVLKKDIKTTSSPNPLGEARAAAVSLAQNHATKNVPKEFITDATPSAWIGIGGVLAISTQNQIQKDAKSFTQKQLEQTLNSRSALTDEQIGGEYQTTEVSNLALVLGYMRALNIQQVDTAKVNLTQGLLLQQ